MEEHVLLELLCREIAGGKKRSDIPPVNWKFLVDQAERQGVLSLLYDPIAELSDVPEEVRDMVEKAARRTVMQSYRLLFLCRYLTRKLEQADIPVVVLKGVGTAGYYPVPELRKSGDVDLLLLDPGKVEEAGRVLKAAGCQEKDRQIALHHIIYRTSEGIWVELHTMLAEPFDNERINVWLCEKIPECAENVCSREIMGVSLPILDTAYHAYELLLHMLQHFLRAGFGLRLLCDWTVFWNSDTEKSAQEKYLSLVIESRIKGFSDMITLTCIRYLGLEEGQVKWMELEEGYDTEEFLADILEGGEFGEDKKGRMVVLRGRKFSDYIREFHHQMHLNFPQKGRNMLYWPLLWSITLVRFIKNNRTIRSTSTRSVLKSAAKRSKMMKQMKLFDAKV